MPRSAVTSRRKRSPPKEPAERFDQTLDACDRGVVDAHDMTTSEPEVTAMTAVTGSADADEQEAYFEGLSSSPGGIAANPFE